MDIGIVVIGNRAVQVGILQVGSHQRRPILDLFHHGDATGRGKDAAVRGPAAPKRVLTVRPAADRARIFILLFRIIIHAKAGIAEIDQLRGIAVIAGRERSRADAIGGNAFQILERPADALIRILVPGEQGTGHRKTQVERETTLQSRAIGKIGIIEGLSVAVSSDDRRGVIGDILAGGREDSTHSLIVDGLPAIRRFEVLFHPVPDFLGNFNGHLLGFLGGLSIDDPVQDVIQIAQGLQDGSGATGTELRLGRIIRVLLDRGDLIVGFSQHLFQTGLVHVVTDVGIVVERINRTHVGPGGGAYVQGVGFSILHLCITIVTDDSTVFQAIFTCIQGLSIFILRPPERIAAVQGDSAV